MVVNRLQFAHNPILIDTRIISRARTIHALKIDTFDALHLACTERSGAVFLTTDDLLLNTIKRHADKITVETKNPVQWFMEVTAHGSKDAQ